MTEKRCDVEGVSSCETLDELCDLMELQPEHRKNQDNNFVTAEGLRIQAETSKKIFVLTGQSEPHIDENGVLVDQFCLVGVNLDDDGNIVKKPKPNK